MEILGFYLFFCLQVGCFGLVFCGPSEVGKGEVGKVLLAGF